MCDVLKLKQHKAIRKIKSLILSIYDNKQKERSLDMPVPRIDIPVYTISEDEKKLDTLEIALQKQGYNDCENPRDMVKIIDLFGLDKSQFDFPYGSYDAFKTHVLSGEYDDMFDIDFMSKEKFEAMKRDIEEGRACI